MRLKLISIRLRSTDIKRVRGLLQKRFNRLFCLIRDECQRLELIQLNQSSLWAVMRLFLQHNNCTLKSINGLCVVLVQCFIICSLNSPHFGGCVLVSGPCSNVRIMSCNLLCQSSSISRVLCNVCLQNLDGLSSFLDSPLLLNRRIIAELLICCELDLLFVFLLLALHTHALQKLDYFLHRCNCRCCSCANQRDNQSCNNGLHLCDNGKGRKFSLPEPTLE